MSASNIKDILGSRRRMVAAAAWMLVLVTALSAATLSVVHFLASCLEYAVQFCHSSIDTCDILSLMSFFQFVQGTCSGSYFVCRRLVAEIFQ